MRYFTIDDATAAAPARRRWEGSRTLQALERAAIHGLESLESRVLMAFSAHVDFQPASSSTAAGYSMDSGLAYGPRGNGLTYGWTNSNDDLSDRRNLNARERDLHDDQRYDTLIKMGDYRWQMAVPDGTYRVRVVAGDPLFYAETYKINVEGQRVVNEKPTSRSRFVDKVAEVVVTDGRLTVAGTGLSSNPISFIDIRQLEPSVMSGPQAAASGPTSVTVAASADTYARDGGTYRSQNYGADDQLILKTNEAGYNRHAYLTFDIGSVSNVDKAKLRLYGQIISGSANQPVELYPVTDANWTESALTWKQRPAAGRSPLATTSVADTTNRWYEWDVTQYIQQQKAAGKSSVSFMLKASDSNATMIRFASKESNGRHAELLVRIAEYKALAAPAELVVNRSSETRIKLSWEDNNSAETGFRIERRLGENDVFTPIATVNADVTSYKDVNLPGSDAYYYRVRAVNDAAKSKYSMVQASLVTASGTFDVRHFGARLNGTTNDAPAIQSAIDAAKEAGGGTVLIPGLAAVGSRGWTGLNVKNASNIVIAGVGEGAGLRVLATPVLQKTIAFRGTTVLDVQGSQNCVIQNLSINGNYGGGVRANLIGVENSSSVKILNNTLYNVGGGSAAVVTGNNIGNSYVGNEIHTTYLTARGLWVGNTNVDANGVPVERETNPYIADNHVHDIDATGIGTVSIGATIVNNLSENNQGSGIVVGADMKVNSSDALIEGNICRDNLYSGIQIDSYWLDAQHLFVRPFIRNMTIRDNVCERNQDSGVWAVWVDGASITGNVTRDNTVNGILLIQARNVEVTNNSSYDTRAPAGQRVQLYGIQAYASGVTNGLKNVTITDNFLGQNKSIGLYVRNSRATTVPSTRTVVTGTAKNITLTGNTISDNPDYGLAITDVSAGNIRRLSIAQNTLLKNGGGNAARQKRVDPIDAPASLTLHAVSSSRIDLSWTDNSNDEYGYRIERKTGANGTWQTIANVGPNVTTYRNTGLSAGKTYYYRIRGLNVGNEAYLASPERSAQT